MFICHGCNNSIGPRISRTLVTVESRPASYPFRKDANPRKIGGNVETQHDKGGQGTEIVREAALCPSCASKRKVV
jgi:hypothetical protein